MKCLEKIMLGDAAWSLHLYMTEFGLNKLLLCLAYISGFDFKYISMWCNVDTIIL